MAEDLSGAILQRDGSTYAVITRSPAGIVTPDHLERVAATARKYAVPMLKITSGQRIALIGLKKEDLGQVRRDLGEVLERAGGPCVKYVQACPGTETCRFGNQDSVTLAKEIAERYRDRTFPAKVKIGVSGCPRCCCGSHTRDIGIMGTSRGWTVIFGGNNGTRPRIGDVVAKELGGGEVLDLVDRLFEYYAANAKPKERTARFMERTGTDTLTSALLRFIPYIRLKEEHL
jgi:NAD(P)H-nitrite reductase large subunit